ncbi:MAG TPA: SUF system NifU family Fe-S cluster assembly protein [Chthonomonadales bacterium]|nr:SUF system NifU family Fe-S cluster assembly protein [Chthonomonadales bacterium]
MYPEPQFDELYRQIILDHYRRPRNRRSLEHPDVRAEGMNPLCGDEVTLELDFEDGVLADAGFSGRGCSISQSSASMMTEAIRGKSLPEVDALIQAFKKMVVEGQPPEEDLGDLEALEGVAKFPVRVKCATLAWNVLQQGLEAYAAQRR